MSEAKIHSLQALLRFTLAQLCCIRYAWDKRALYVSGKLPPTPTLSFTAVKRVKFAKVKRNTAKLRLLLSLSKV